MAWNLIAPNTWSNSKSPYLIKFDSVTNSFIVEDIDGKNFIPLDDIFNNPAFPIDLSNSDILVKSIQSSGIVTGTHLRSENLNTPTNPGHSFKNEINSGFYRESPGILAFSVLGNKVLNIDAIPSSLCKAWVSFNGISNVIRGSNNISSVTKNNTGDYTINFANSLPDANYSVNGLALYSSGGNIYSIILDNSLSTSSFRIYYFNQAAAFQDNALICLGVFR